MQLTPSELNIMQILWKSDSEALTKKDICSSPEKSDIWKESTFFVIINGLIAKGAVTEAGRIMYVRTPSRLYKAAISPEKYYAGLMIDSGMDMDFNKLFDEYLLSKLRERAGNNAPAPQPTK